MTMSRLLIFSFLLASSWAAGGEASLSPKEYYFAHPSGAGGAAVRLDAVYRTQATFILTDALKRLSVVYGQIQEEELLSHIANFPPEKAAAFEKEVENSAILKRWRRASVRSDLATWNNAFPALGWKELNGLSTEELDLAAHALIREVRRITGIGRFATPLETVSAATYGVDTYYQDGKLRTLRTDVLAACPWGIWSCKRLVDQVFDIVKPHHSPLDRKQLEGLSLWALEQYFPDSNVQGSELAALLHAAVNGPKTAWTGLSDAQRIRIMSAATHNHGFELYAHLAALEWIDDPHAAHTFAAKLLRDLNQLYRAMSEGELEDASRPYHAWGGAAVACALVQRGYSATAATSASSLLGAAYETLTFEHARDGALRLAVKDTETQADGAQWGATACSTKQK